MLYFDTSYIVKCYLTEAGSTQVRQLTHGTSVGSSQVGRVEFFAALHRIIREGFLDDEQAAEVHRAFREDDQAGYWHWFGLTTRVLSRACNVFDKLPSDLFLRASDALHLATAKTEGFAEIYSNDRHLLAAAQHFGLQGINLIH